MSTANKYREGDVLTFANGNIGVVTKQWLGGHRHLATVNKAGWATPPRYMPRVADYVANNPVLTIEHNLAYDQSDDMAEAA